jgi:hypothetical protein
MKESVTEKSFIPYDEQYALYYPFPIVWVRRRSKMKHVVVEVHLMVSDGIHQPFRVAKDAAKMVEKLLKDTYTPKDKKEPLVTVPIVSHRIMDVEDTSE